MFVRELPTTCLGENLKTGVLRVAEYCVVESVCLLVFFTICAICDVVEVWGEPAYYDVIPIFLFLLSLVKVLANVLLFQGTNNGNGEYLKLWLYVYGVNTAVMLLFMLGTGVAMAVAFPPKVNAYLSAAQCILFVLYCAIFKYLCQVVYAYKRVLQRQQNSMTEPMIHDHEIPI